VKALAIAALLLCARVAWAGDPDLTWRTVETDHFVIHYYAPLDDVARRVGVVAERAHRTLSPALDHLPDVKTIIVILDNTDSANGFAGVLPRNAIQLYATGPTGFNELDTHDDWLYGLVAHEYTHILHLDTMDGLPNIYNGIFGKTWAPNQIMPRWIIEGIAVYEESKRSGGGRNRGTRFDQYIRIARHEKKDLRLDEVSGQPRQYPRGNAIYVYGSHFLRYVFDRFGDDALRQMAHTSGSFPAPFATNRQIAKVVGKPFTELFDDWKAYLRDHYGMQEMAAERRGLATGARLTKTAEANYYPHYSADGKWLVWQQSDGYTLPAVRRMPVGGTQKDATTIAQIDAMGPFDLATDGSFVYEQTRVFRREYSFQDLFRYDAKTGEQVRLTTGRRARDPSLSPDGRRIAYSENHISESVLAVMPLAPDAPSTVLWKGERYDEAYEPAWSPDGTRIAFSAWRHGGLRDILVIDVESKQVTEVTRDRAIDAEPSWSADGRYIYFESDRTGISNIYAYDTRDASVWQVTNVFGGAFGAHASPDGTRLAYYGAAAAGGYDIYEVPLAREKWIRAHDFVDARPDPVLTHDDEAVVSLPRPYRALESLAPQTWTGSYNVGGGTTSGTIQTGGTDAVGLHSYSLALTSDLTKGTANIGASYGYDGWRPSVRVAAARTLVERGGLKLDGRSATFDEEDWSGTLSVGIPLEQRPSSSWSLSFDYDADWYRLVGTPRFTQDPNQREPIVPASNYYQAGVGTRVAYSGVRTTTFGLGPTTGWDAAVSLRLDHPDFGARYHNVTVSYSFDGYQRLWGVTPMLYARLTGAWRAGDTIIGGGYALGGIPAQDVAMAIVNSTRAGTTGYLRGYPSRELIGNQYHLLNLEYRQELWRIEHGLGTIPVYLRRVHMGILSDTGAAWNGPFSASQDIRTAVGAALRLDTYLGYFVPGTFELGYSRGLQTGGVSTTWFLLTGSI
jgi:hypothetical protein